MSLSQKTCTYDSAKISLFFVDSIELCILYICSKRSSNISIMLTIIKFFCITVLLPAVHFIVVFVCYLQLKKYFSTIRNTELRVSIKIQ